MHYLLIKDSPIRNTHFTKIKETSMFVASDRANLYLININFIIFILLDMGPSAHHGKLIPEVLPVVF